MFVFAMLVVVALLTGAAAAAAKQRPNLAWCPPVATSKCCCRVANQTLHLEPYRPLVASSCEAASKVEQISATTTTEKQKNLAVLPPSWRADRAPGWSFSRGEFSCHFACSPLWFHIVSPFSWLDSSFNEVVHYVSLLGAVEHFHVWLMH